MFERLKALGILGINRRIGEFILPYNPRSLYPLVDSKIITNELCVKHNIPTPALYWHIDSYGQLKKMGESLKQYKEFVIKPSRGAMGNGILIINQVNWQDPPDQWIFQTSKGEFTKKDIEHFISDILSGMYSLNGSPDTAIIQEKLIPHPELARFSYKGIPDIRVIVFKGYPVMSMLRLPTSLSRGRANLHQGAIGCGVELSTGKVNNAIWKNKKIKFHPDTDQEFTTLQVPFWDQVLLMAVQCFDMTGMGYLGVDIVLDEKRGPLLLEINARPGLAIQTANMKGLLLNLNKVKELSANVDGHSKVEYAVRNF